MASPVYADDAGRQLRARGRRALRLEDGLPEWRRIGGPFEFFELPLRR